MEKEEGSGEKKINFFQKVFVFSPVFSSPLHHFYLFKTSTALHRGPVGSIFLRYRDWKYYTASFFTAFIFGCFLYAPGVYHRYFASSFERVLASQIIYMFATMKELSNYQGNLSAAEIAASTENYIQNNHPYAFKFLLEDAERGKKAR